MNKIGKFFYWLFKNDLFWIIILGIFILSFHVGINIAIAYLWSFLINEFLSSYLYLKLFIILILFFYNYFILRFIVVSWIFEFQFPIQTLSIYIERQTYIHHLQIKLKDFVNAIEVILNNENFELTKKQNYSIDIFLDILNMEFDVYDRLYNIVTNNSNNNNLIRYEMSRRQINYYNLLKEINNILYNNNLKSDLLKITLNEDNISDIIITNNLEIPQNPEFKTNLGQLNRLLNDFKKILDKYDWDNYTFMSPAYLFNSFFNDTFSSLSLNSIRFKKRFEEYELDENFTKNGKIHYTLIRKKQNINNDNNEKEINLISEKSKNENDEKLLIFCIPNGCCYESMAKEKVAFYLNHDFSFLCWNYRGYGYSKGWSNFSNVKSDVLDLYDTIVENPKYKFKKICVMGHSIGGVPSCHLVKHRHIDLLISDRNFCDMTTLVKNFYCGQFLSCLLKYLFIGKTDNIDNIINNPNIKNTKIIIYSPSDSIIFNDSTVKSGIAKYIIKKYIIYRNNENNQIIKNKENILDIVFNKNDKSRFINNFSRLVHFYNENINNILNKLKKQNEQIIINENDIKFNEAYMNTLLKFFDKLVGNCDDLKFLTENKLSLRRETLFIDNYFNNLLIWGVKGYDEPLFYAYKGKTILKESYDILNNDNIKNNEINNNPPLNLINNVAIDIKKIIDVMNNLDIVFQENDKKINIKNDINIESINLKEKLITPKELDNEISTSIKVKNDNDTIVDPNNFYGKLNNIKDGIKLLKTNNGHNGLIRENERETLYELLLSSEIII